MLKKVIKYVDFDGNPREETFLFNLTKAEIMELELSYSGGLVQKINKMVETKDVPLIIALFKEIILMSYGEKSPDGKRFVKSKELSEGFSQTEAYSELFMELAASTESITAFINAIIPQEVKVPNLN